MTKELKAILKTVSTKVEKVNTNNAWGFGGAVKTVYHLANGSSVHQGTAYYRHARPTRFLQLRDAEGYISMSREDELFRRIVFLSNMNID